MATKTCLCLCHACESISTRPTADVECCNTAHTMGKGKQSNQQTISDHTRNKNTTRQNRVRAVCSTHVTKWTRCTATPPLLHTCTCMVQSPHSQATIHIAPKCTQAPAQKGLHSFVLQLREACKPAWRQHASICQHCQNPKPHCQVKGSPSCSASMLKAHLPRASFLLLPSCRVHTPYTEPLLRCHLVASRCNFVAESLCCCKQTWHTQNTACSINMPPMSALLPLPILLLLLPSPLEQVTTFKRSKPQSCANGGNQQGSSACCHLEALQRLHQLDPTTSGHARTACHYILCCMGSCNTQAPGRKGTCTRLQQLSLEAPSDCIRTYTNHQAASHANAGTQTKPSQHCQRVW